MVLLMVALGTPTLTTARDGMYSIDKKVVKVTPVSESKYSLTYLKNGSCQVQVSIQNVSGKEVLSDMIKTRRSFKKIYDFKGLPNGLYSFILTDEDGTITKKITYNYGELNPVAEVITFEEEEKVKVTVKSNGRTLEPVSINIYDSKNELIFGDYVDLGKSFSRKYDVSKLKKVDKLTVEVIESGKVINK